jgi:hypothetical protein
MLRRNFLILAAGILAGALAWAGSPEYYPSALGDFDGAADYLTRGADLTGNSPAKLGVCSFWFRVDGGDGLQMTVFRNTGGFFNTSRMPSGVMQVYGHSGSEIALTIATVATFDATSPWHHFMASWDTSNGISHLYIDEASDNNETVNVDTTILYNRPDWAIGAKPEDAGLPFNGSLSEVYLNTAEYLDLSVEANRPKFISADGYPVDLGPSGYKPTGTAPIVYMRTQFNNCGLNSGTGGDFTINGSPDYTVGPVPFPLTTWSPGAKRGRGGRGGRSSIH